MIREPSYTAALVTPERQLTRPLVQLLQDIVREIQGSTGTDLTSVLARLDELEQLPAQIESIRGTNGITVLGSLESGMEIRGSTAGDVLANQIFGG